MGRINPEHRGAEASAVIQWDDKFVWILRLQAIHKMNLGANGKGAAGDSVTRWMMCSVDPQSRPAA